VAPAADNGVDLVSEAGHAPAVEEPGALAVPVVRLDADLPLPGYARSGDAGADLVLGSSPHLLRAMELYKGRLIAYSLGNFSTWDTFNLTGPLGISGILKVSLASNGVATRVELIPTLLAKPGRPVPDPARQGVTLVRSLSAAGFGAPLRADASHRAAALFLRARRRANSGLFVCQKECSPRAPMCAQFAQIKSHASDRMNRTRRF